MMGLVGVGGLVRSIGEGAGLLDAIKVFAGKFNSDSIFQDGFVPFHHCLRPRGLVTLHSPHFVLTKLLPIQIL